jgi:putative phosphoserine phosphatase/1-acylglycerol-3-phosphate O-acyltransferase
MEPGATIDSPGGPPEMALHARLTHEIRAGPSGPKVGALFDLDQTLLAGFSAAAFFRERLLSGRMAPRELLESFLGALRFGLGRTDFSGFVSSATAGYRGLAESVLDQLGQEVFEKHLAAEIYPESRALVRAHQEMGHTVAVVSSATRYQAGPLARDLGIPHVLCTRLELENGALTGGVVGPTCYGEGKVRAVRELAAKHDVDLGRSYFYTDSHEDLRLLEAVGNPRPTNPDRRLARVAKQRGWPVRRFHSRGTPSAVDLLRSALVYGSVVPSAWAGLAAGIVSRSRREGINVVGSIWADLATALAGVDLRVEGEEHVWSGRPAVFIFNHQSGIDPLLMIKLLRRDMTGVGEREVRWNPIFGPLFRAAGVVFIDRSNTAGAIEALRPAVEALRQGLSLAIAPEGTRSPTPRLGRFKKGAFHIAMQAGVPIVPVVFRNALDALPRRAIVVRPATVEAVVLPPVDTSEWRREDLDAEIEAIRSRYLDVLGS